ncbi:MAG: hypothetical protein OHK0024_18020 [Thalassobaculales bacterium]
MKKLIVLPALLLLIAATPASAGHLCLRSWLGECVAGAVSREPLAEPATPPEQLPPAVGRPELRTMDSPPREPPPRDAPAASPPPAPVQAAAAPPRPATDPLQEALNQAIRDAGLAKEFSLDQDGEGVRLVLPSR